jgi:uncharacterized protein (TIGR00251 family)
VADDFRIEIQPVEDGCRFHLRVKPKAFRDSIIGAHGGALKLSVRDAPEKGRANHAVCALLARVLAVAAADVVITSGETAQNKTVRIRGLDAEECLRRLENARVGA